MFLTSDVVLISWGVQIKIILGRIGVEYDNNEIDDGLEEQKWTPINWCKMTMHIPHGRVILAVRILLIVNASIR